MLKLEVSYRGIFAIVASVLAIWAFIELWPVLLLVLISAILAIGLLPYVDALVRAGVPRGPAVLLVMVAILVVFIGAFSLIVPAMIDEFADVQANLPESARELEELLAMVGINVELQERARNIDWGGLVSGRAAVTYGQQVLSTTISLITIVAMTAYLLADKDRVARFFGQFIPDDRKGEAERLFLSVSRVVGGYLRGQLITSVCIGIFTFVLLSILGVPNPLAFAVLAAFADVVPLIGSFVATVPPTAAALQQSSTQALAVIVAMIAYQQFEDRFLVPRVYGRTLNLPPIIVLIAVLAGAELLGITGVLLALPLAAAARVAIDYTIENRHLPLMAGEEPLAPDQPDSEPRPEPESRPASRRRPRRSAPPPRNSKAS
ncbi:MAG: AI-2E family transporter [Dehalococcoidia bacterium]|nr:AI-2E family transporter [Dehalococcoidia bacterium]